MRTTSPVPVYRSSRDTRNAPLWNPSSKHLQNVEEDEAGRLSRFRERYGQSFNVAGNATAAGEEVTAHTTSGSDNPATEKKAVKTKEDSQAFGGDLADMFGEEDDNALLQMISDFGKKDQGSAAQLARKKI